MKDIPQISSLYIHIPYCGSKCSYCDFFSIPTRIIPDDYIKGLLYQLDCFKNMGLIQHLNTVYFGGGTPSLLTSNQTSLIMEKLSDCIDKETEITFEVNPESLTHEFLDMAPSWGINRISMGIQSLDDRVLSCVGRCCTASRTRSALDLLAKSRLAFCTDFIAGLPGQDDEGFLAALKEVINYRPYHISLYSLTVAEETRLYRQIEDGQISWIPDEADKQWILGRDLLEKSGYFQYEVSNFAPVGQESRHNSAYWKQKSYLGLGAGAAGTIYNFDLQGRLLEGFRYTNTTSIDEYLAFWQDNKVFSKVYNWKCLCDFLDSLPAQREKLDRETLTFEHLMLGLRMRAGINEEQFYQRFEKKLPPLFEKFCLQGWMEVALNTSGNKDYKMTREGLLFLNQILEELLSI